MNLPKIIFKPMTLERNIKRVIWTYLYEDNTDLDVKGSAIELFPELNDIKDDLSINDKKQKVAEIVTKKYNEEYHLIEKDVKRYNDLWAPYNDKYFTLLSEYLKVEWPSDKLVIEAEVGIIPTCPRFIDTFSFQLFNDAKDLNLIRICAHETLHFLWFEKWKQMYPNTEIKGNEIPYLVWKYSEMVTDPILNNKSFKGMFELEEEGYDSFYEIYDGDIKVMDKLRKLYSEDKPIEEKIDEGFKIVERVENLSDTKTR